jgi:hypothetical protein
LTTANESQRGGGYYSLAEPDTKTAAAFSALLLFALLETKPDFHETAATAYRFYEALKITGNETEAFERWLRSG